MHTNISDVEVFLRDFKLKMSIWDVFFRDDRGKNTRTLLELELSPNDRKEILQKLIAHDFSEGPLPDTLNMGSDMWVFGKLVKKKEVYIKITMGRQGTSVICISFHLSEHVMKYPFKK